MTELQDLSGKKYSWEGDLRPETLVSVDGQPPILFSSLITMTNGEIYGILEA